MPAQLLNITMVWIRLLQKTCFVQPYMSQRDDKARGLQEREFRMTCISGAATPANPKRAILSTSHS